MKTLKLMAIALSLFLAGLASAQASVGQILFYPNSIAIVIDKNNLGAVDKDGFVTPLNFISTEEDVIGVCVKKSFHLGASADVCKNTLARYAAPAQATTIVLVLPGTYGNDTEMFLQVLIRNKASLIERAVDLKPTAWTTNEALAYPASASGSGISYTASAKPVVRLDNFGNVWIDFSNPAVIEGFEVNGAATPLHQEDIASIVISGSYVCNTEGLICSVSEITGAFDKNSLFFFTSQAMNPGAKLAIKANLTNGNTAWLSTKLVDPGNKITTTNTDGRTITTHELW